MFDTSQMIQESHNRRQKRNQNPTVAGRQDTAFWLPKAC
jgi:hypothetical protein